MTKKEANIEELFEIYNSFKNLENTQHWETLPVCVKHLIIKTIQILEKDSRILSKLYHK